jgi:putative acyl-CoA dehydrogenase
MSFFQDGPELGNQYEVDTPFQEVLARYLPEPLHKELTPQLDRLGERTITDIWDMGQSAENNPPRLVQYEPWGRRVDRVEVDPGWLGLGAVAAEEGLISIPHTLPHGSFSRLVQFAKLYLYHPSSMVYTCPVAMSDGAARLLELYGSDEIKERALPHLLSNDPDFAWTSGQWMTETTGGSDLSRLETVARKDGDNYRLYGNKYYCSAATSQMAIALARIEDASGNTVQGSRGLSTFYLETGINTDQINNMSIGRLKDKMGSRALPSAEITLEGTAAKLVGKEGAGVRQIATLFNLTRVQNGLAAVSDMRRMISFVRDYGTRREAFGERLVDLPLFAEVLAQMETEVLGSLQFVFYLGSLLGKEESGEASAQDTAIVRILMPLAKLYTAKQATALATEGIEAMGAATYMEDTALPRLYRDALAYSIWEGTTNVLCLDTLRAIVREGALEPFLATVTQRTEATTMDTLTTERNIVLAGIKESQTYIEMALGAGQQRAEASGREIAFALTHLATASLLLEHAQWAFERGTKGAANVPRSIAAARRWCHKPMSPQVVADERQLKEAALLAKG